MTSILKQLHFTGTTAVPVFSCRDKIYILQQIIFANNSGSAVQIWVYFTDGGNYDANSLVYTAIIAANTTEILSLNLPFREGLGVLAAKVDTANVVTMTLIGSVIG